MVAVLPPAALPFLLSPLHYRSGMIVLSHAHQNAGQPALSPRSSRPSAGTAAPADRLRATMRENWKLVPCPAAICRRNGSNWLQEGTHVMEIRASGIFGPASVVGRTILGDTFRFRIPNRLPAAPQSRGHAASANNGRVSQNTSQFINPAGIFGTGKTRVEPQHLHLATIGRIEVWLQFHSSGTQG